METHARFCQPDASNDRKASISAPVGQHFPLRENEAGSCSFPWLQRNAKNCRSRNPWPSTAPARGGSQSNYNSLPGKVAVNLPHRWVADCSRGLLTRIRSWAEPLDAIVRHIGGSDGAAPSFHELPAAPIHPYDMRRPSVLAIGGAPAQSSSKVLRTLERLGCFSFLSAFASIWRMRSRVTENCWPTSSSV